MCTIAEAKGKYGENISFVLIPVSHILYNSFTFHSKFIHYDLFTSNCGHTLERCLLQCINKIKFLSL